MALTKYTEPETMKIYKEIILDFDTGLETKIEFTSEELIEWQANQELAQMEAEALAGQEQAKAEARQSAEAKLLALGLTTEDLKALLG